MSSPGDDDGKDRATNIVARQQKHPPTVEAAAAEPQQLRETLTTASLPSEESSNSPTRIAAATTSSSPLVAPPPAATPSSVSATSATKVTAAAAAAAPSQGTTLLNASIAAAGGGGLNPGQESTAAGTDTAAQRVQKPRALRKTRRQLRGGPNVPSTSRMMNDGRGQEGPHSQGWVQWLASWLRSGGRAASGSSSTGAATSTGGGNSIGSSSTSTAAGGGGKYAPQSIGRRMARARWAILAFLPHLALLLLQSELILQRSHGWIGPVEIISFFLLWFVVVGGNECSDMRCASLTYTMVFSIAFLWGALLSVLQGFIAWRLFSMAWAGVALGHVRYHWALSPGESSWVSDDEWSSSNYGRTATTASASQVASLPIRRLPLDQTMPGGQLLQQRGATAAAGSGSGSGAPKGAMLYYVPAETSSNSLANVSSTSTKGSSPPASPTMTTTAASSRSAGSGIHWLSLLVSLTRLGSTKVGFGLAMTIGEFLGCFLFASNAFSLIAASWVGTIAVALVPLIAYKCGSCVSHVLVILCGTRVNTADATRLLKFYWVLTTILSLASLVAAVGLLVWYLVPLVWALQGLAAPYAMVLELVTVESKEAQDHNPYAEVAELYAEHIAATVQNSKEYLGH